MAHNLIHRLLPFTDREHVSAEKRRRHPLTPASAQAERDDIMGYFVD